MLYSVIRNSKKIKKLTFLHEKMQFPVGKVGFFVGNCIFSKESYYNYKSSVLQKSTR